VLGEPHPIPMSEAAISGHPAVSHSIPVDATKLEGLLAVLMQGSYRRVGRA
jgi:hypothetical protein